MEKTIHQQDNQAILDADATNNRIKANRQAEAIKKKVASAIGRNDHTGALIIIAKAFQFQGSLMELEEIKRKHKILGYMTGPLIEDRRRIEKHMDKLVREISPNAADIIHNSL